MTRHLLSIAVLLLATATAYGDSGAILLHQDAGPFSVTIIAAPQPLETGSAEISVLVQDRASATSVLVPQIDLTIDEDSPVRLSPSGVMQSARVQFPRTGQHKLAIVISHGNDVARLATTCQVRQNRSRAPLVWFYVLLPVVAIALFAWQQVLKVRHGK